MIDAPQSPEAELDRDIEELVGKKVRGTFSDLDGIRLIELQSRRTQLMRRFSGFVISHPYRRVAAR